MIRIVAIVIGGALALGVGLPYLFTQHRASVRHAEARRVGEAIARADEYWDAGALLFEPRYLEAEKAVAGIEDDPLGKARLEGCLTQVKVSRDYLGMLREQSAFTHPDPGSKQDMGDHLARAFAQKTKCLAEAAK